jgi:tetratricopeptide (TPR) repeat protein
MERWHISAALLRGFIDRTISRQDSGRVVRHLLQGCHQCSSLLQRILQEHGYWGFLDRAAGFNAEAYDLAFEAARSFTTGEQRRLAESRLLGWAQWASLESLTSDARLPLVLGDAQYHHWGLYKALLDASLWYLRDDPIEAVEIVALALEVGHRTDPTTVGGERAVIDLEARAWAFLGNAQRVASKLDEARSSINKAWKLHEQGTGDELEKALILSLDASWARTMGEFEVAEEILDQALTIYRRLQDNHLQGRTLLKMGDAIGNVFPKRGVAYIRRALELINAAREPRLELCAQHDLAWFLNDAGQSTEALAIFHRARPLYKQFFDRWTQVRFHWIQGKIARGMGHLEASVSIFQQVQEALREGGADHDELMVAIDLSEAFVASGKYDSAARTAAELVPVMQSWRLHRHAITAWLIFQQALDAHKAEELLIARLRSYYLRHWNRPSEEFTTD